MKRIALLLLLLLTACSGAGSVPPAPTAASLTSSSLPTGEGATPAPTPTETAVPTPTKVDVRYNIPAKVEKMVGGETYQGFLESIGESGEIRVTDYESGRPLDFIIAPETVRVSETADCASSRWSRQRQKQSMETKSSKLSGTPRQASGSR